ncbi:hypothetical protein [Nocardioides sp. SR21]|uniref:hypothetical protein n=1 Tax=Nocardioides sp. SR21 TaxID=2919501 RepID=UPI001FA99903|nr:hypothetical protein [Nocardioides sp. SR21]
MTGRRIARLPWWLVTAACLVVAVLYVVVWPADQAFGWLHPAAWLLFAAAATCHGLGGPPRVVQACVTAAGLCYGAFAVGLVLG